MTATEDRIRLQHMLDAAQKVLAFTQYETRETLEQDEKLQLALVRLIEIIGEAAARLSIDYREAHTQVPWAQIIGMRNRLIHAYFDVDLDRGWETSQLAIPPFISQLETLLAEDDNA